MKILVCGLRGSGKSTWAKENLQDGICYDMDAIASAFRLRMPHEEYHPAARRMANDFLSGFLYNAEDYADPVIIIRTAPSIDEARMIEPDVVVILYKRYVEREMDDAAGAYKRLRALHRWALAEGVSLVVPEPPR